MIEIQQTSWHAIPALSLESDRLRVVILPDLGAKIVSLFDKTAGHEWLVPPMRPLKQTAYGDDFVSQDMSGWDEMMPTIVACKYEGASLPDHGEVWSIPWQVQPSESEVTLTVAGVALPYRLTRRLALVTPDYLELRYHLVNQGTTEFPYLWAAHPQFNADPHTRLVLPSEVTQVVNVIDQDPAWGPAGSLHAWPAAVDRTGQTWRLDRVRPAHHHTCRKFYVPPEQPASWAALVHEGKGCQLRMEWSPSELPYLGLWVDEGAYNSLPAAAFEPSNAYYDSLARAVEKNKVPYLKPGEVCTWTLRINFLSAG
jgi:galactose mutarotase-like enzyme